MEVEIHPCFSCSSNQLQALLRIDNQPISNRFLQSQTETEYTHPITLSQCNDCGLVQLSNLVPWTELVPRYNWIKYNEPEKHLDDLVERIIGLPNIRKESTFLGVSYKEDSTLKRLSEKRFNNSYRLNESDLEIENYNSGIETMQANLTPRVADKIRSAHGASDVVIARHILEHSYNPSGFIEALKILTNPNGHIILEVPDTSYSLEKGIYTAIWEEHTMYFTSVTFQRAFPFFGLSLYAFHSYPYPIENSLVAITTKSNIQPSFPHKKELEEEISEARAFSTEFNSSKKDLHKFFSDYGKNEGRIAFLGAGHHSCAFINYFELGKYFNFVADDDLNKQGLYMPGSRLPICPSKALVGERGIKLCLMALSPESEERALQRNRDFIEKGGELASVFKGSTYALKIWKD